MSGPERIGPLLKKELHKLRVVAVREILKNYLSMQKTLTYGELAEKIGGIRPGSAELSAILKDIMAEDDYFEAPFMCALVVNKNGIPGKGFFEIAKELGYDVDPEDEDDCWDYHKELLEELGMK